MYDSVMRQRNAIIAEVVNKKPELEILISDALDAPFFIQNCQCPGKMHRVEKLVDVWVYYEQVPTLRLREVFIGRVVSHKSTVYADTTAWLKLQSPRIGTGCGVRFLSQCQMWNRCSCS
jgi:hypothetical protein